MKRYPTLKAYVKGRTQEQVAAELGIRQGQLSKYLRGEQMPRLDVALRIHKITGVPLEALIRTRAPQQDVA